MLTTTHHISAVNDSYNSIDLFGWWKFGTVPGSSVCSISVSCIYSGYPSLSQQRSYKGPRLGILLNGRQATRQVFAVAGMGRSEFHRQFEGLE